MMKDIDTSIQYGAAIVMILIVAAAATTMIKWSTGYYMVADIPYSVLRIESLLCTEILRLSRSVE